MAYQTNRHNRKHTGESEKKTFTITRSVNEKIAEIAAQRQISKSRLVTELLQDALKIPA